MPYFRVSIEGSVPLAGEVFSTGFAVYCPPPNDLTQDDMNAWAEAIYDYIALEPSEVQQFMAQLSSGGQIDRIRIYRYAAPGQPATALAVSTGVPLVGAGVPSQPLQCATVWSLLTGIPGRSYRGRMYWPKWTGTVNAQFRNSSVNDSMAQNAALFINTIAGASVAGATFVPAVASVTLGEVTPVTSLRIGNVIDTQRRRRDNNPETYYSAPV